MNPAHNPWESWEIEFVAETYPDPDWDIHQIAEKLERDPRHVYSMASRLKLKRPDHGIDHARVLDLRAEGLSLEGIATVLECSKGGVQRVLKVQGVS